MHTTTKTISIGNVNIGGPNFTVIAGPCSIESFEQTSTTAAWVFQHGATILRGGIYKLRTNPSSFQGLGSEAFAIIKNIKASTGMPFVTEISDPRQLEDLNEISDMYQVGSRNMHNYALLKELGHTQKPILLKRGFCATIEEWILAARYITDAGNPNVIFCERGIRTFETATRNTLDLSAVAVLKQRTDLPVVVDPSHGTGVRTLVTPMALAAAAAGADGIMVEVHPQPKEALSDGFQALTFEDFEILIKKLKPLLAAIERPLLSKGPA